MTISELFDPYINYIDFLIKADADFKDTDKIILYFQTAFRLSIDSMTELSKTSGSLISYYALHDYHELLVKMWNNYIANFRMHLTWDRVISVPCNTLVMIAIPDRIPISFTAYYDEGCCVCDEKDGYIQIPLGGLPSKTIIHTKDRVCTLEEL